MNLCLKKIIARIIPIALLTSLCINGIHNKKVYADTNTWNYDFVGQQQTFTAPYSGTYKLETWGSQGGDGGSGYSGNGGRGGYACGQILLIQGEKLYIYVGGQGKYVQATGTDGSGAWNGGGVPNYGGGGGGASDIRTISGTWDNPTSLNSRIIVAGGGGGAYHSYSGGYGGGLTGGSGISNQNVYTISGGTQISGGTNGGIFGIGASQKTYNGVGYNGAGGGGGWYGGGSNDGKYIQNNSGGGGSSYIGGVENGATIAGNSSMPSISAGTEIGHSGNGYVRISYKNPILKLNANPLSDTSAPVTITASASSPESVIEKIQTPDGNWINGSTTSYVVNKNGTYAFTAIDKEGYQTIQSITVSNILSKVVLNVEPEKSSVNLNETISANLIIDNITEIAAEDVKIKYDNTRLEFLGYEEVDGIMLAKTSSTGNELRFILASKGVSNIVNSKKTLLKLNFKGIATGNAYIDITSAMVSDGIKMKKTLVDDQCGQSDIKITDAGKL